MTDEITTEPRSMMGFGEAIKTCFGKYANFKERATRAEFWWFALFTALVSVVLSLIECDWLEQCGEWGGIFEWLWTLATFLPSLAVGARRLHDIWCSGWWQLLLLTGIGLIPLIIMWCLRTNLEVNQYDSSK